MNEIEKLAVRILARQRGHAIVIRETRAIADDPADTIGIAGIRVVTEDQVQALAFGSIGTAPQIIARLDPLTRATADLEPFADWLCQYAAGQLARNQPLRVWVPHKKTVEMLAVLGRRYERNQAASPSLREAARICRILAAECSYEGQQTVAIAQELLIKHVVTGQMPVEDLHSGAILAWVAPAGDPAAVAAERSRIPASGLLPNTPDLRHDDEIERLRKTLKTATGGARGVIEGRIQGILDQAVTREWRLLVEMRQALLALPLASGDVSALASASQDRVRFAYERFLAQPTNPVPLVRHLEDHEAAISLANSVEVAGDRAVRAMQKRTGRVVEAVVARIVQLRPNRRPCTLVLQTNQPIVRLRLDVRVKPVGVRIDGHVRALRRSPDGASTEIDVEIKNGVKSVSSLLGTRLDWFESSDFPAFLRQRTLTQANDRGGWLVTGSDPSAAPPVQTGQSDLLALANQERRS
jgi:hypothetical protein